MLQQVPMEQSLQVCYLSFQVSQKSFFQVKTYLLSLNQTEFTIYEKTFDSQYKIVLSLSNQISWQTKKTTQGLVLESFGIQDQNKLVYFYSSHENLVNFKNQLAGKIMFLNYTEQYQTIKQIGEGSFGIVQLVRNLVNNNTYACKIIHSEGEEQDPLVSLLDVVAQEVLMLNSIQHQNVVKFYEIFNFNGEYFFIFEYLEGGSLKDLFDNEKIFSFQELQLLIFTLLETVAYMHSLKIMHRDLKPSNLMFSDKNNMRSLKIVDFDMATSTEVELYQQFCCGTPGYIAPEIANLKNNKKYDVICDLFSVGAIFYKLLTNKELFIGDTPEEIFQLNCRCLLMKLNQISYNVPDPNACMDLLKKLLNPRPKDRISAQKAMLHPFFDPQLFMVLEEPQSKKKLNYDNIDVEVPDDPTSAPLHQSIIINKLSTATNSSQSYQF